MLKALVFIAAIVPGTAFLPSALPLPGKIHNLKCYQNTRKAGNDLLGLRMGWLDAFTIDKMYGAAPGSKVDQVFYSMFSVYFREVLYRWGFDRFMLTVFWLHRKRRNAHVYL